TIMSKTYTVFELFFAAGIIYLLLSWLLIGMFRLAEKRINRHLSYQPVSNGSVTA
ncbi:ABC transporter permease, partial [Salmonella enterica subsp. enterica]|nr:ABC transporter permease [Salmonella enterica subsp. enterica]